MSKQFQSSVLKKWFTPAGSKPNLSSAVVYKMRLLRRRKIQILFQCRNVTKKARNMIGPADPISNLHPIKYVKSENETPLEKKLREHSEELQAWNNQFWTRHNSNFIQRKREFECSKLKSVKTPSNEIVNAEEMSVFYKQVLDENWKTHLSYLFVWYKKTFYVTFLQFQVFLQRLLKKS